MQLQLESVTKQSGTTVDLHTIDLTLVSGSINVLLGATLAGKTSLLRIMAGLDRPTSGRVLVDGHDVTGISVRKRNLAMVYQQFINYPSLTVFENIASPLRIQRRDAVAIKQRVGDIAEALRLTPYLDRLPTELSGGQQQRTALGRALAKDAALLLLDEPLVNLDYKLREELRAEIAQLFRNERTTVVYATTEPQEALQLGGHTAILHCGTLLQFGLTLETYLRPQSLKAAQAFSDPPLNILTPTILASRLTTDRLTDVVSLGVRSHQIRVARQNEQDVEVRGNVELAEISGSETYLHVKHAAGSLVAQLPGVHNFVLGENCSVYIDPATVFGFGSQGELKFAPHQH
jgi:glycerol transport system ATP-binding protein